MDFACQVLLVQCRTFGMTSKLVAFKLNQRIYMLRGCLQGAAQVPGAVGECGRGAAE
jgi:hypothetical protein